MKALIFISAFFVKKIVLCVDRAVIMNMNALYKYFMLLCSVVATLVVAPAYAFPFDYGVKALSEPAMLDKTFVEPENVNNTERLHYTGSVLRKLLKDTDRAIFTFDDGPHPHSTPQILATLKKHNIKAVFFVLGCQAKKYPELVKKICDEGHIIGNHTYNHVRISSVSEKKARYEICETNSLIESITGKKPTLMRPPYGDGASSKKLQKIAAEEGMSFFLWTVDPTDWKSRNAEKIIASTESQLGIANSGKTQKGGVVLMHDIYPSTADSLEKIISDMERNDYCFIKPDEISKSNRELRAAKAESEYHSFDPNLSGNKLLVALLTPPQNNSRGVDIIRAHRQGNLMLYLALRN